LLAIVCPAAAQAIQAGDIVKVDLQTNQITCDGEVYTFPPFSPSVMGIIEAGGLVEYVKQKISLAGA
jgi:3-isopropylmalate/(R)-2-methylmalate dehydratase small subunit